MAAKYFKSECGKILFKESGNRQTRITILPNSEIYEVVTDTWTNQKPGEKLKNIPSTAREFQEAYLRAKTALDEIVSAE